MAKTKPYMLRWEPNLYREMEQLASNLGTSISKLIRSSCELMVNIGVGGQVVGFKPYELAPEIEQLAALPGRGIRLEKKQQPKNKKKKPETRTDNQENANQEPATSDQQPETVIPVGPVFLPMFGSEE